MLQLFHNFLQFFAIGSPDRNPPPPPSPPPLTWTPPPPPNSAPEFGQLRRFVLPICWVSEFR